jgi:hypothetical protein
MYNGNTVSLKEILWRAMNNPRMSDLSFEDAAEYAIEALSLIGAPLGYKDVTSKPITIVDYKAALPLNLIDVKAVKMNDCNTPLTYATDMFHSKNGCEECNDVKEYTYTYSDGVIKTSFEAGDIVISYKALVTDEDGFPLIPDNPKVKLAIRYYIMYMHLEPLYHVGKISDKVFNQIEQNKDWYIGASQSSMQIANMDHAEAIANSINRLLLNRFGHSESFAGLGKKEIFKRYY